MTAELACAGWRRCPAGRDSGSLQLFALQAAHSFLIAVRLCVAGGRERVDASQVVAGPRKVVERRRRGGVRLRRVLRGRQRRRCSRVGSCVGIGVLGDERVDLVLPLRLAVQPDEAWPQVRGSKGCCRGDLPHRWQIREVNCFGSSNGWHCPTPGGRGPDRGAQVASARAVCSAGMTNSRRSLGVLRLLGPRPGTWARACTCCDGDLTTHRARREYCLYVSAFVAESRPSRTVHRQDDKPGSTLVGNAEVTM